MRHVQLIAQSLLIAGSVALGSVQLLAKPVTATIIPPEDKDARPVEFTFKTLKMLKINGWSQGPDANPTGSFKISGPKAIEGAATFKLTSLTTEMPSRDGHMAEDMKYDNKPENSKEGKMVLTSLPWEDPSSVLTKETKEQPFEGKLTLNKTEKPVTGLVSTKSLGGDKVQYVFHFMVKLEDFGLTRRTHFGIQVPELVAVDVTTLAKVVAQ